jgi:hypothetical protein
MNAAVPDEVAMEFALAFYDALASGSDIPFAFKYALTAPAMSGLTAENIPILLI